MRQVIAMMHTDHKGADAQCRSCPLMVSVLPQQKHHSADRQAPDARLMAGKLSCGGANCSRVHSPCTPEWWQGQAQWGQDEW